jgi:hypothetical protein
MMTKKEAIDFLKGWLEGREHKAIHAIVTEVSRSGMSRKAKFYIPKNDRILNVTPHVATLLESKLNGDGEITLKGCGMNMLAWAVMRVSKEVYGDDYRVEYQSM